MPVPQPLAVLRRAAGPPDQLGLLSCQGRRTAGPAASRRRFSLPVAGSLRYRLLVAWLAVVVVAAGGVLWLQRAARPRNPPPRVLRPGVPAGQSTHR